MNWSNECNKKKYSRCIHYDRISYKLGNIEENKPAIKKKIKDQSRLSVTHALPIFSQRAAQKIEFFPRP